MKIFGIPVKIEPAFFIITFFLGTGRGASLALIVEWMVVVLISVLLHELGHALTAKLFKLNPSISLYGMGGLTYWNAQFVVTPVRQLMITLAGPVAGFVFGLIVFLIGPIDPSSPMLVSAYDDLLWVNIGWGVFNLLPMLPMDGGNVLATLETWIRGKQSRVVSHSISLMLALGFFALALSFKLFWVGLLAAWFGYSNGAALVNWYKSRHDVKYSDELESAQQSLDRHDYEGALDKSRQVLERARSREIQSAATGYKIFALLRLDRFKEAREEITKFEGLYGAAPYFNGLLHYRQKQYAEAVPYLQKAFEQTSDSNVAVMLTESLSRAKRFTEALEFLDSDLVSEQKFALAVNIQSEAFSANEFESSAAAGAVAYQINQQATVAYNNACAFSRAGEVTKGLYWLELAINSGFNDRTHLTTDPDLELLRQASGFASLLRKIPN